METMDKLRYTNRVEAGTARARVATLVASTRIRPLGVAGMTVPVTTGAFHGGNPDALDLIRRPRIE